MTKNARTHTPHTARSHKRQHMLAQAQALSVPQYCDVCVVGGGASGLVSAIVAAEAGAQVVLVERELEAGRSILPTGNGRCNFCNVSLDATRYNQPAFVQEVCGKRWLDDVLHFFREAGLRWSLEDDRLYPLSRQAASVRNVLLARAHRVGVVFAVGRNAQTLEHAGDCWQVRWQGVWEGAPEQLLCARSVVLAVGGGCISSLAESLGCKLIAEGPVLVPLACESSPLSQLDGRRVRVVATLYQQGVPQRRLRGEVLFRSYGLSGIAIFDLSRTARPGDIIALDLAPEVSTSELAALLGPGCSQTAGALDGILDPAIASVLDDLARTHWQLADDERLGVSLPRTTTELLMALVKGLPFRVRGIAHPELAQVHRGGLAIEQLDTTSLAIANQPGLFACGEAIDVDGDCGGFNLAWAWKSGMVAGAAAAEFTSRRTCV